MALPEIIKDIEARVKDTGDVMTGSLHIQTSDVLGVGLTITPNNVAEHGQINLNASTIATTGNGIAIDNLNGEFRIYGLPSADGVSKVGYGNTFTLDPYASGNQNYSLILHTENYKNYALPLTGGTLSGNLQINGYLRVGNNANGDNNYIAFYGTTGDQPGTYTHAYIGENLWGGSESSELVLFKGNDPGTASGPDRIRYIGSNHTFQVYSSALSGSFSDICDSTLPTTKLVVDANGITVTGTCIATSFSGPLSGNASSATKATQDGNGAVISSTYLKLSGGTMTGALNLANGTWNKSGDDAQFGDNNIAGAFNIQGLNGTTSLRMVQYGGTAAGTISWTGSQFVFSHGISGNVSSSSFSNVSERLDSYDTRSTTRTPQDTPRGMTLNFKQNSTYSLSDGGSYLGLLSWRSYSSGSDLSGGYPIEIAYTANGNLWTRMGASATTWGGWNRIINHSFLQERGLYKDYGYQTDSSNWPYMLAANQFFSFTNWWDSTNTYMPYIYGSGLMLPHLDSNYRSFLYCQCNAPIAWVGWVNKSSTSVPTWKRLWGQGDSVTGAVWNDYAEYRESDLIEPGYCLIENGDDTLSKSTERMQAWAGISSDTWGFAQGQTDKAQTPIAVAGRVLVYPYRDRNEYKPGDCVCTAPDGKVDIMTEEEIYRHPDRIIGVVSCVPDYEEWGGGENADRPSVKVDGRIWVRVK